MSTEHHILKAILSCSIFFVKPSGNVSLQYSTASFDEWLARAGALHSIPVCANHRKRIMLKVGGNVCKCARRVVTKLQAKRSTNKAMGGFFVVLEAPRGSGATAKLPGSSLPPTGESLPVVLFRPLKMDPDPDLLKCG